MRKLFDDFYSYSGAGGGPVCCHLVIYKAAAGIVAIARELRGSRGAAARQAANLAYAVWQAHGAPGRFTWIEEATPGLRLRAGCTLVEFSRLPGGGFADPRRRPVSRQALTALIAQDYAQEWPPGWLSVPAQGLQMECLGCQRRLGISAILSSVRYCPACQGVIAGTAPPISPPHPPTAQELLHAREEFRQRVCIHEQKLGVNPIQRMHLFYALAGTRSLWEFRPEELRLLATRIEEFDSIAEVEEFIDVHLNEERLV